MNSSEASLCQGEWCLQYILHFSNRQQKILNSLLQAEFSFHVETMKFDCFNLLWCFQILLSNLYLARINWFWQPYTTDTHQRQLVPMGTDVLQDFPKDHRLSTKLCWLVDLLVTPKEIKLTEKHQPDLLSKWQQEALWVSCCLFPHQKSFLNTQ